jgi:hypothetical protein
MSKRLKSKISKTKEFLHSKIIGKKKKLIKRKDSNNPFVLSEDY